MKSWLPGDLWDGMRTQPGRIGLSLFAIAVGMLALTLLVIITGGLERKSARIIRELGVDVIALVANPGAAGEGLARSQVELLRTQFPGATVSGLARYVVNDADGGESFNLLAVDERLHRVRPWRLRDGRFLDANDVAAREPHCLVSRSLAEERNWIPGATIPVGRQVFRIAGVFDPGAEPEFSNPATAHGQRLVVVPHRVEPYWQNRGESRADAVDVLYVKAPPGRDIRMLSQRIGRLLEAEQQATGPVSMITAESLVAGLRRFQRTVHLTMGSVSLLCLVLGGTTLMSLMIANVKERLAEIGLRLSLGASGFDIALLFLLEGLLVSLAAAGLGIALAHAGLYLFAGRIAVPVHAGWPSLWVPLAAAAAVGAVFSFLPARFAARIPPSEALRNE